MTTGKGVGTKPDLGTGRPEPTYSLAADHSAAEDIVADYARQFEVRNSQARPVSPARFR